MDAPVLSSTFFLTLLLGVGLAFFIRASVKERIERVRLVCDRPMSEVLPQVKQYFLQRSYRIVDVNADGDRVTFEGEVSPSWFLAVLLASLAAVGFLCLALVLSTLFPNATAGLLGLVALSPLAGVFYWKGAARTEQVALRVEPSEAGTTPTTAIVVQGHRDELKTLEQELSLTQEEEKV